MTLSRRAFCLGVAASSSLSVAPPVAAGNPKPWLAYYNDTASLNALFPYDLLILDSQFHPPLRPLKDFGKLLYGYLSVGEVAKHRPHFAAVEAEGLLLQENENWEGSFFIDIRDSRWTQRVVETLIPTLLEKGFEGVFLDTLDNPLFLENQYPDRYEGMTAAASSLVRRIRDQYPSLKIIVNRAYKILTPLAPFLDGVLGESVYASYDFETQTYGLVEAGPYRQQVEILQSLAKAHSHLKVLTLDYWDPTDAAGISMIYAVQRANGFEPYVSTIALNEIIPEP